MKPLSQPPQEVSPFGYCAAGTSRRRLQSNRSESKNKLPKRIVSWTEWIFILKFENVSF